MQSVEAQELNATEQNIEVYVNDIELYLHQYCEDRGIKLKDLYMIDQSRWNSVLLYIYKHVFKPLTADNRRSNSNIDYSDNELLNNICDIYINLCYEYSKEVSILGFSKLTGINPDTIYSWANEEYRSGSSNSDIHKKLNREREESLSNKLASGKGNPVGILGMLNRHYGWNMGQPRGQEQHAAAPAIPELERKYLPEQGEKRQFPEFPEPE